MERRRRRGKRVETEVEENRESRSRVMFFVGKRGGPSTPPPAWRLHIPSQSEIRVQEFLNFPISSSRSPVVSARKLCSKLWEALPHHHHQLSPLNSPPRLRRRHSRNAVLKAPKQFAEPPGGPSEQPNSAIGLKGRVQASLVQRHHRSGERKDSALHVVSPANYHRSMEVAPNNRSANPTGPKGFKSKINESCCHPKTSRELLKVLSRIRGIEEQHASSISVMKSLKIELDLSRAQVKELLHEKQMNKQVMESLMKQIREDKPLRNNKEYEKVKNVVESTKEEIEDERRLRKHLESLHLRLAKELSEAKSSFFDSMRDLERERRARILLENLCDDFAKGIRDYEQEVRSLRQNADNYQTKGDNIAPDRLILHISEAWLDERMQMKQVQSGNNVLEGRGSIVDTLGADIETYLHAKGSVDSRRCSKEINQCTLNSLNYFPTKEATNAAHNVAEEDYIGTDIFEQKRTTSEGVEGFSSKPECNDAADVHKQEKGSLNPMRKQDQSDENESWFDRMTSSQRLENIVGSSSLSSEGDKVYPESICKEGSCVHSVLTANAATSPLKHWKPKLIVPDVDKCESSSSKLHSKGVNGNTLMAKLLEVRLEERQKSSSTACKSSF